MNYVNRHETHHVKSCSNKLKEKTFNIRISQCLDSMVRMSVLFTNRDIARWKYYIQLSGIEQKNSCCQIYNNIMRHILRIMQEIRYHIDLHNAYVAYTTLFWIKCVHNSCKSCLLYFWILPFWSVTFHCYCVI